TPGDGSELGLGVDRDREAGRLEHGKVARRVRVGNGVSEREALGIGELLEEKGPSLTGRRRASQLAGEPPVAFAQARADDLVEQGTQGLDHEVKRTSDQK